MTNPNNNPDDLDYLTEQENELEKQLDIIKQRKRELAEKKRRELEANKPVAVTVTEYNDETETVFFTNGYREDLIEYLRKITSRQYDGRRNYMKREDFLILYGELNFLDVLKNVSFSWQNQGSGEYGNNVKSDPDVVRQRIIYNTKVPHYVVSIDLHKQFKVEMNNGGVANPLHVIPGNRFNYDANAYLIPLSEGWRLYTNLSADSVYMKYKKYRVEWTDEALNMAVEQAEKRNKLIALHTKEDSDLDAMFLNGYKLRPFQGVGVEFAEATNGRWMLGDQTGLGKTWQYLAYTERQARKREVENPDHPYMAIVCCPANLVINWLRMIKQLTGQQPYVCTGTKPAAIDFAYMMKRSKRYFIINYDILSTKNEFETRTKDDKGFDHVEQVEQWPWVEGILKFDFDSIAFDEAHYLKNVDSLRSRAGRKLTDIPSVMLATATPVVNRVDELWPLLHIIDPHTFMYQQTFVNQYSRDGKFAKNVEELKELMKFIMIRRKKSDVQKDLPAVNDIVRYHKLSVKANKIYEKILMGVYQIMDEWDPEKAGQEQKITHILAQIIRLKQVCAIDKAEMVADLATEIRDNEPEDETCPKVIIFSQFIAVAKAIHKRLNDGGRSRMFSGEDSPDARMRFVDEFQTKDDVDYLVMTSKVAAEGLTLTKASTVIFADLFWTPKDHEQCIGRAWGRLNDSHGVDAVWCIADGTIEDWINQLLAQKRQLIGQVVDGKEITGDESVSMELIKKMREEMFSRKKK